MGPTLYATYKSARRTCSTYSRSHCFRESSTRSWRCSARSPPLKPHSLDLASLCPTACVRQCVVQVLDWRLALEDGQYQVYADALFGAAADALLAPPMQVPQILVPWDPPVGEPKQGVRAQPPAGENTSATDAALPPASEDPEHVQL